MTEGGVTVIKAEEAVAEVEAIEILISKRIRIKSLRINLLSIDS